MTKNSEETDYIIYFKNGCQICGRQMPNLKKNGLEWCHIVEEREGGTEGGFNSLALCPNCHVSFDSVIKPAIFQAIKMVGRLQGKIPESWRVGTTRTIRKRIRGTAGGPTEPLPPTDEEIA